MLEIDNNLLFLNLNHKSQVIWDRFQKFLDSRQTHLEGDLLGFYPSRDFYAEFGRSVYEIRFFAEPTPGSSGEYATLIWDYIPPTQKGLPMGALEYFKMRPEYTTLSYKPVHYYKSDAQFLVVLRKLHPKLVEFIKRTKKAPLPE
jgi:hypothetical protein